MNEKNENSERAIKALHSRTIRKPTGQISSMDANFLLSMQIVDLLVTQNEILEKIAGKPQAEGQVAKDDTAPAVKQKKKWLFG